MRFHLEDGIDQFHYQDAQLLSWRNGKNITIEIGAPVAKATNPQNEEYVDRFVEALQLHLMDAQIVSVLKEGYRYYNADNVLQQEVPDQEIAQLEWDSLFSQFEKQPAFLFRIEPVADLQDAPRTPGTNFRYRFYIDLEDVTYLVEVDFSRSEQDWERFQNRATGY